MDVSLNLTDRRVLIVDDQRDTADTLAAVLRQAGLDVLVAYDSREGLDHALWFKPDVAIWDLVLPGMDGFEAARRLRAMHTGRRLFLLAITALPTGEHAMQSLAAGFDRHLAKPVDLRLLLRELANA